MDELLTADAVKQAYLGKHASLKGHKLKEFMDYYKKIWEPKLENGGFKNYKTTIYYVKRFLDFTFNCWDNAPSESFFKTLKAELVYHETLRTRKEAESAISDFIEIWYNRKRRHSSLNYQTPYEKEMKYHQQICIDFLFNSKIKVSTF